VPSKPVATSGDVHATAGPKHGTVMGTWTPGPIVEVPYPFLTVGGVAVLHQASCLFAFAGSDSSTAQSTVTLTAASTVLQKSTASVLRNGDTNADADGNTLTATATGTLLSS
jgi:hypothetical protein